MYSIAKHLYQDDGMIVNDSFAIDKKNLLILRVKIMVILIDETSPMKSRQTKVI
jgi:hypothetical protein